MCVADVAIRSSPDAERAAERPDGRRPLRVLMYQFFPGGGIGRYTHELCTALHRRGDVAVEVVCTPDYEFRDAGGCPVWDGLQSISSRRPLIRRSRFLIGQFVNPVRLLRRADAVGADVLHFANINHFSFPVWKRRLRRPERAILATAHDVRRASRIINRRWEDAALKDFYRICDGIFVHSESQRRDLCDFAGVDEGRIHTVPHGPYPGPKPEGSRAELRARHGVPQDRDVALCFGSIRDDKNLANTLRALTEVPDRPFVVIAGRSGGKGHRSGRWYQQLIHELKLTSDVLLMDRYIADQEVGELFALSDLALLTYSSRFTSQSGVLNVAMHFERPVVTTDAPTMAETISDYSVGVVCGGDDPAAIREGILRWRDTREEFTADRFARYRDEHGWERNAELTVRAYHRALRTQGANPPAVRAAEPA